MTPTTCLASPPVGVEIAPDLLRLAAAALEHHRSDQAEAFVRAIDAEALDRFWFEGGQAWERRHRQSAHHSYEGPTVGRIDQATKLAVARRDGWRCRYCDLRVATAGFLKKLHVLLPAAFPLGPRDADCHPAYRVLRCTQDHVVPRWCGGTNDIDNVVTSCGGCNFNKGSCGLDELGLVDPRSRPPLHDDWDGLYRRITSRF